VLVDARMNAVAFADWNAPNGYGLTLDDVEDYLSGR